jgi:hypothetical protein
MWIEAQMKVSVRERGFLKQQLHMIKTAGMALFSSPQRLCFLHGYSLRSSACTLAALARIHFRMSRACPALPALAQTFSLILWPVPCNGKTN